MKNSTDPEICTKSNIEILVFRWTKEIEPSTLNAILLLGIHTTSTYSHSLLHPIAKLFPLTDSISYSWQLKNRFKKNPYKSQQNYTILYHIHERILIWKIVTSF